MEIMTMRKRSLFPALLMILIPVLSLLAEATTLAVNAKLGGPRIADVLGYDPGDRKVYYTYTWEDESGLPPQLYYFSLASPNPDRAVTVKSWYKDQRTPLHVRLNKLRERLVPLTPPKSDPLSMNVAITRSDRKRVSDWTVPRFFMNIELAYQSLQAKFEIIAYCNRRVGVVDWHQVPGEDYAVANFTFTGDPFEVCYETQTVVLLSRAGQAKTSDGF
jgi:hypothetical protein